MRGFSDKQRLAAFCEINLFLLCAHDNTSEAHMREWAFKKSCVRYGEKAVRKWYRSLDLKAPRKEWL